jgi:hypothetical protein
MRTNGNGSDEAPHGNSSTGRARIAAAGFCMQLALGAVYGWSVLSPCCRNSSVRSAESGGDTEHRVTDVTGLPGQCEKMHRRQFRKRTTPLWRKLNW